MSNEAENHEQSGLNAAKSDYEALDSSSSVDVRVSTTAGYAGILAFAGDLAQAETLAKAAAKEANSADDIAPNVRAAALSTFAYVLSQGKSKPADVEARYLEAVALLEHSSYRMEYYVSLSALGHWYDRVGRTREAEEVFTQVASTGAIEIGYENHLVINAYRQRARYKRRRGNEESIDLLRAALKSATQTIGYDLSGEGKGQQFVSSSHSPTAVDTRYELAHALQQFGHLEESTSQFRLGLNDARTTFGPDHPHTVRFETELNDAAAAASGEIQAGRRVSPSTSPARQLLATQGLELLIQSLSEHVQTLDGYAAARLQSAVDILIASGRDPAGINPVVAEQALAQAIEVLLAAEVPLPEWVAKLSELGGADDRIDGSKQAEVFNAAVSEMPNKERNDVQATAMAKSPPPLSGRVKAGFEEGIVEGAKELPKTLIGKVLPGSVAALVVGAAGYWGQVSGLAAAVLRFLASIFSAA